MRYAPGMSDEGAIRDLISTWMEATKRGDTRAVLDLMTDDVVFLVAGQAPFGKEAFARASEGMKGVVFEGTNEIAELRVLGDHAYVRSQLSVRATMPDGKVIERAGPGLTIYRKENGQWKLARDANLLTVVNASR
jgi:uncharacterized protein (TIGR02246 family)